MVNLAKNGEVGGYINKFKEFVNLINDESEFSNQLVSKNNLKLLKNKLSKEKTQMLVVPHDSSSRQVIDNFYNQINTLLIEIPMNFKKIYDKVSKLMFKEFEILDNEYTLISSSITDETSDVVKKNECLKMLKLFHTSFRSCLDKSEKSILFKNKPTHRTQLDDLINRSKILTNSLKLNIEKGEEIIIKHKSLDSRCITMGGITIGSLIITALAGASMFLDNNSLSEVENLGNFSTFFYYVTSFNLCLNSNGYFI